MAAMKPSARLLKLLKPPSKIANTLDWKKNNGTTRVATLHIGKDRIGMAIAAHPELGEHVQTIRPLEIALITKPDNNHRSLAPDCIHHLQQLCEDWQIGGFLVWWPLQKEGRAGAPCGKVMHTLESILAESTTILTPSRPVALWTGDRHKDQHEKYAHDNWGRSSVYSRCAAYDKTIHFASTEQYCHPKGSSASAAETWEEFCKQYWPDYEVYHHHHEEEEVICSSFEPEEIETMVEEEEEEEDTSAEEISVSVTSWGARRVAA